MKKLFITAAIATMFSVTAFAADGDKKTPATGEEKISHAILNQFNADFKGAQNTAWAVTSNCEKATFTIEGVKMTAFYDLAGAYLGTTETLEFKDIPYSSQLEITAKYKGYAVTEVIKYKGDGLNKDASTTAYFVDLKKTGSEILVKAVADQPVSLFKTVK